MGNPFEAIDERLLGIENQLQAILAFIRTQQQNTGNETQQNEYVDINEAVKITGFSKSYIYELRWRKAIPYIKKGNSLRFSRKELEAWLRSDQSDLMKQAIETIAANHMVNK